MKDITRFVYGLDGEEKLPDIRRIYNFSELVPTQSSVYRHRLWRAERKLRKGEETPEIIVMPAKNISEMFNQKIPSYPVMEDKFYIWDGHARAVAAKKQKDGIFGRGVTEEEMTEEDMLGTVLDQKITFLYMTHGLLRGVDQVYVKVGNPLRDFILSLRD